MHVEEIYVIFIHLFDSGILLIIGLGLGLRSLTSLSTIFQLYRGGQFY